MPPPNDPPADHTAERHWYEKAAPADQQPEYEQVISPARAVQEAVSQLGGTPDAEAVRRHLSGMGITLDAAVIEQCLGELRTA